MGKQQLIDKRLNLIQDLVKKYGEDTLFFQVIGLSVLIDGKLEDNQSNALAEKDAEIDRLDNAVIKERVEAILVESYRMHKAAEITELIFDLNVDIDDIWEAIEASK